jgi:hypothetical protein
MDDESIVAVASWARRRTLPACIASEYLLAFREFGLPVDGNITCIISVIDEQINAAIASPSGLVYQLGPGAPDRVFWQFAAKNYYMVTGNLADRQRLSKMIDLQADLIEGKALSRESAVPSELSLDDLLKSVGYDKKLAPTKQDDLWDSLSPTATRIHGPKR